jgi:tetratricopeptide (TPR) repeat protein
VIILIIIFNNNNIYAQNNEIDSLINKLSIAIADTLKVDILIELSKGLTDVDLVNGEKYVSRALELSKTLDYSKGEADAYYYLGVYDFENSKFKDGAINQSASLRICLSQDYLRDAIYSNYELGSCYESLNSYDSAHYFYKIAFELSDSIGNDTLIAHSNYYLAEFPLDRGQNKVALKYAMKAHEYYNSHNLKEDDWYGLNILGIIHSNMGLYAESLDYNLKALDISIDLSNKNGEIIMGNNIAVLYNELKKNDLAIKYYEDAYETTKIIGDPDMEAILLGNLAGLKAELGDTTTALLYTRKALSIQLENGFTCALPYSYEGFGDLFIGQNMLDSAVYYLKRALEI